MAQDFDVVISGGGLSGLLTAIGLLNQAPKLTIAIAEPVNKSTPDSVQANFDGRCIALSYGSLQLLQHWQVWPALKPLAWPIRTIVTSDRGHAGKTIMKAQDYDISAMGYVAEMRHMGTVFQSVLTSLEDKTDNRIQWFCPDAIEEITQEKDAVNIKLQSETQLKAKLLVVAEGGHSPTRAKLGMDTESAEYPQAAVIANVKTRGAERKLNKLLNRANAVDDSNVSHHVAFERFATTGPIALLPIGEQEYSLVWTDTPENAERHLALSETEFISQLQQDFGFAAGEFVAASKPALYPLSLIKATRLVQGRAVLVGNSAHTVHPIAGQGFNLGLRDIAVLVQQIAQAVKSRSDIGGFTNLNEYQGNRQQDIDRITGFTDLLVRGFGLEGRLPAAARTLGLMSLQKCDGLQQWLALHFMSSSAVKNIPQLISKE